MYRHIRPDTPRELPLRMLFQPAGDGLFNRACEADSFRALVAAILDDPGYETADAETRLVNRLRIADDVKLIAATDGMRLEVADRGAVETINIASDEPLIRSLDRLGFVSLEATLKDVEPRRHEGGRHG